MPVFLTSRQLAVAFGVKPRTVTSWLAKGTFPNALMVQLGPRFGRPLPDRPRRTNAGTWYVPLEDVEAWLAELYAGERMLSAKVREALIRLAVSLPTRAEMRVTGWPLRPLHLAHPNPAPTPETQTPLSAETPHVGISREPEKK